MQERDLFFAKTTMPDSNMLVGRVFAVKSVAHNGQITAFILARESVDRIENPQYYKVVKKSSENLFKYDTAIDIRTEFQFDADWKFNMCRGKLAQNDYNEILEQQAKYLEIHELKQHGVQEMDAAMQRDALKDMVETIKEQFHQDPKKISEYLKFKSQFYKYSPRNCLLMMMQNPDASFVGSYTRFKQLGYSVRAEEYAHPMEILAAATTEYIKVNGKLVELKDAQKEDQIRVQKGELETFKRTRFFPCYVYDISQTNCPKSDYPKLLSMGKKSVEHSVFYQTMKQISIDAGIPVEEKELRSITLHGYYDRTEKSITINSRLDDTARATVIIHEFAHGLLHQTSNDSTAVKEFEAQALALSILYKYDFPLEENERGYLARYFTAAEQDEHFDLEKSLTRISKQLEFVDKNLETRETAFAAEPEQTHKQGKEQMIDTAPEQLSPADILENFMEGL